MRMLPLAADIRPHGSSLQIFPQQWLCFQLDFFLQDQRNPTVKLSSRICRAPRFSPGIRHRHQTFRLTVLHRVVPDVINQVGRLGMALQCFREFLVRNGEIFFLPPAIPCRKMPFGCIHLSQLLDLRQSFLFAASHDARSAAIEFDQDLPCRIILGVELYRCLKFSARFLCQRHCGEPPRMIRLFSIGSAQPLVIDGILCGRSPRLSPRS